MGLRSDLRTVSAGTLIIVVGFIAGSILEYGVKALLARSLGPQQYGLFTQGIAVVQILAIVGILGLHQALPRFMASQDRGRMESVATALVLGTGGSAIVAGLLYYGIGPATAILGTGQDLVGVLRLFAPALVPLCLFYLAVAMLRGIEDTRFKVLTSDVALPLIEIGLLFAAFRLGLGLPGAVWAYLGATVAATVLSVGAFVHLTDVRMPDRLIPRQLLAFAWPLFLVALITTTNKWIDVLMLGRLATAAQAGIYEVAMAVAGFLVLFLSSLNYIFMPVATRLTGDDPAAVAELYRASTRWITGLSGPLLLGMLLFPGQLIGLLFGSGYQAGATALTLLSIGYFVAVMIGPAGMLLVAAGRTRWFLAGGLTLLVTDVALNLVLIPAYGMTGAAIALSTALIASNLVMLYLGRREIGQRLIPQEHGRILAALGLTGIPGLVLAATGPGLLMSILYGGLLVLIYAVMLWWLDAVPDSDIELVRDRLPG